MKLYENDYSVVVKVSNCQFFVKLKENFLTFIMNLKNDSQN